MSTSPEGSFEHIVAPLRREFSLHEMTIHDESDAAIWDKLEALGYSQEDILEMFGFTENDDEV